MAGSVRWKATAKADLREITQHYLKTTDKETAIRVTGRIFADLKKLADTPMLDRTDERLRGRNRRWFYVKDGEIEVYYERLSPTSIRVVKLWPARRDELDLGQIK